MIVQPADTRADFRLRNGGDLVDHQTARGLQAVARVRGHRQTEQRRVRLIRGEGADGDGVGRVEAVVLKDDDRARFPGIALAAGVSLSVSANGCSGGTTRS